MTRRAVALFLCLPAAASSLCAQTTYESLNAVVWAQRSIEFQSNAIQTYKAADAAMHRALQSPHWTAALEQTGDFTNLPPAVILDLDETVLDNSAFMAQLARDGKTYTEPAWENWVSQKRALAIPGAVHFLNAAALSGVSPIYITNRACQPKDANDPTLLVLQNLRIPVSPDHLLCKATSKDSSDKSPRRALVARTYRILLLLGDDVNDFVTAPTTLAAREELFKAYEPLWGEKWFILPNAMYGSWERAVGLGLQDKLHALRP